MIKVEAMQLIEFNATGLTLYRTIYNVNQQLVGMESPYVPNKQYH